MFKTQILADKLTHLTDARYFAARDVDIVCFSIDENEDLTKAGMSINAMKSWIEGPKVFLRPGFRSDTEINELCNVIQPHAIVCNFLDTAPDISSSEFYLDFIIEDDDTVYYATSLISKLKPSGIICEIRNINIVSENVFIDFINVTCKGLNIYLKTSGPLESLNQVLHLNITGLAIDGSTEEKLGIKSFDEIDQFLDTLEV